MTNEENNELVDEIAEPAALEPVPPIDNGDPVPVRSRYQFRTGKYVSTPIENVPTEYLRSVLRGDGDCHLVLIELNAEERQILLDVIESRAAGKEGIAVELEAPKVEPVIPPAPPSTDPVPVEPVEEEQDKLEVEPVVKPSKPTTPAVHTRYNRRGDGRK